MSDEQTPLSAAGWTLSIGAAGADSTAAKGFHAIYRGESLGAPIRGVLAVISHGGGGRNRSPRCDPICRSGSIMSLVPPSRSIAPIAMETCLNSRSKFKMARTPRRRRDQKRRRTTEIPYCSGKRFAAFCLQWSS